MNIVAVRLNITLNLISFKSSNNITRPIYYIGLLLNDRYKIKRKLGKGQFGLVYLVDDTKIDDIK